MRTRIFYVHQGQFLAAYQDDYLPTATTYEYVATIDTEGPEDAWAKMNRGSGKEVGELQGQRSMSVGDIVYLGDLYFLCRPTGWQRLPPSPELSRLYAMAIGAEGRAASPLEHGT